MKKGFKAYAIAWLILLALFNVAAFMAPAYAGGQKYTASFWIGYMIITLAFVGNLICAKRAFEADNARKLFYNMPLINISYTALIISFVVGGACMLVPTIPYWIAAIAGVAVLAFTAIAIIKTTVAEEIVENVDKRVEQQTSFIKDLTAQAENIMHSAKTPEVKAACKKVYEAARFSDPMSVPELSVIEAKIIVKMNEYGVAVLTGDVDDVVEAANSVMQLINERNSKCKGLKR